MCVREVVARPFRHEKRRQPKKKTTFRDFNLFSKPVQFISTRVPTYY